MFLVGQVENDEVAQGRRRLHNQTQMDRLASDNGVRIRDKADADDIAAVIYDLLDAPAGWGLLPLGAFPGWILNIKVDLYIEDLSAQVVRHPHLNIQRTRR